MAKRCSWCNDYIGDDSQFWSHDLVEDGKKYKSKEIFCSPKCSHEYPHQTTPDKSNYSGVIVVFFIIILIYLLG